MRWPGNKLKDRIKEVEIQLATVYRDLKVEREFVSKAIEDRDSIKSRAIELQSQLTEEIKSSIKLKEKLNDALEAGAELTIQLEDANSKYSVERQRRIQAESISSERLQSIERAYKQVDQANRARDEAIHHKFQSLDLVNTSLLRSIEPERERPQPQRDPSTKLEPLIQRSSALSKRRKIERSLVRTLQTMAKAPYPVREIPKESVIITPEMPIEEVS